MKAQPLSVQGVVVALAVDPDGPLSGIILTGPSSVGKSSLAISLIGACPWQRTTLIADDMVDLTVKANMLLASAPSSIAGLIEVRGVGLVPVKTQRQSHLTAVIECLAERPKRLPELAHIDLVESGIILPRLAFWVGDPAPIDPASRVRLMVRSVLAGQTGS